MAKQRRQPHRQQPRRRYDPNQRPRPSAGARLLMRTLLDHRVSRHIELEYPVVIDNAAPLFVDLYLHDHHICIEYQGPHHALRYREDGIKRANLWHAGIPVLEITYLELEDAVTRSGSYRQGGLYTLLEKVRNFISSHGISEAEIANTTGEA